MQFTSTIIAAALAFATGSAAWAQDQNGVWVANNTWYTIRGAPVHEACTRMNSEDIHFEGCAYWTDGIGSIFNGQCQNRGGSLGCW
ncbi:uncharacterized protein PG998_006672 [Apiospora kogelbergensis]|uniref:Uncharacterized protein n=1 Tax=Apiospora kogelbergensis TaxID=1337665 RepID=A0AAW0QL27_9PEZI